MLRKTIPSMALLLLLAGGGTARGQLEWEYSPYQIRVWIACESAAEFTPGFRRHVRTQLERSAKSWAGAVWSLQALDPPSEFRHDLVYDLEAVDIDRIEGLVEANSDGSSTESAVSRGASDSGNRIEMSPEEVLIEEMFRADKLIVVGIASDAQGYRIRARELDCRTRVWSTTFERHTTQLDGISRDVLDAVRSVFVPIARVDGTKGRTATLLLRAGGLAYGDSPAKIDVDGVLRPVIRHNDRKLSLKPIRVDSVPWTYLTVSSRTGAEIECEVQTGVRSPLRGRSSRRTEKLALAVRARAPATRLVLTAKSSDPPRALVGYEVLERGVDFKRSIEPILRKNCYECHNIRDRKGGLRLDNFDAISQGGNGGTALVRGQAEKSLLYQRVVSTDPKQRMPRDHAPLPARQIKLLRRWIDERAVEEAEPQVIGLSDWNGFVDVPPGDGPVRIVYVRHGAQLLARLPVVPGAEPEMKVDLTDDDTRMEAEGAVISMQRSFMDAVARQQVMAIQIRKLIKRKRFNEAEQLLEEMRKRQTRDDFTLRLENRRREFNIDDPRIRTRINLLFNDAREMFNRHLDPRLPDTIAVELRKARGA